jgi:hypothetical protein
MQKMRISGINIYCKVNSDTKTSIQSDEKNLT